MRSTPEHGPYTQAERVAVARERLLSAAREIIRPQAPVDLWRAVLAARLDELDRATAIYARTIEQNTRAGQAGGAQTAMRRKG